LDSAHKVAGLKSPGVLDRRRAKVLLTAEIFHEGEQETEMRNAGSRLMGDPSGSSKRKP